MDFVSESYSFASNDGRIVMRACIDRPLNFAHNAFEYLNQYSRSIHEFVNDRLLLKALEAYDSSVRIGARFLPYLYSFKYYVTYSDDTYWSCAMVARLMQATNVLMQSIDSVVFIDKQILPPRLINHSHKQKNLVFDADGFPSVVELSDGRLSFRRVGKKSVSKQ